jgi:hypothetical protein
MDRSGSNGEGKAEATDVGDGGEGTVESTASFSSIETQVLAQDVLDSALKFTAASKARDVVPVCEWALARGARADIGAAWERSFSHEHPALMRWAWSMDPSKCSLSKAHEHLVPRLQDPMSFREKPIEQWLFLEDCFPDMPPPPSPRASS